MSTEFVILNEYEKENTLNSLKKLMQTTRTMSEWIKNDTLRTDIVGGMTGLLEFHFTDIAKILGYETHLIKEMDDRYKEIREVKNHNYELEQMIASLKPIDGLKEQLNLLSNIVSEWWKEDGFHYVGDFQFHSSGSATMRFCFMLSNGYTSMISSNNLMTKAEYIESVQGKGFEIEDISGRGLVVLDTPNNRILLRSLLLTRFPSIRINSFVNQATGENDDIYIIHAIDATIFDLKDIPVKSIDNKPIA